MKFNFKKISAITASALMMGMTMGVAAAANYPNPFVVGGTANVGVVYGTGSGVSDLDQVQAYNLNLDLQSYMGSSTGTPDTTVGEVISLDTSSTRIWINTSLNTAKQTLTKSDLPTVLKDSTFSGNVDAKLTSTIKIITSAAAGAANSGKVIFAKQPKSSADPKMGISLGSSTQILYNASVTMKSTNFSHSDSEGETITLFGKEFVVSTATTAATDLVLFSSAEQVSLSIGGTNPSSATINVAGTDYLVELITGSGTTSATIAVDGEQKQISAGASKKVGGIEVAIKTVTESTALDKLDATLLVGSEKITLTAGSTVTMGADDDPVDGTIAYVSGTPGACTEIAVAVYRPDSSNDAILPGESFIDPVFKSFKIDFTGLSSSLDDTNRDTITIENAGDDSMSISFTDSDGNSGFADFAHNQSGGFWLGDDSNYTLFTYEMANVTEDQYIVLGNEDYGHLLKVIQIYNNTGDDYTDDKVKFEDEISSTTYSAVFTSEGSGTVSIDGKSYGVTFKNSGDDGWTQIKYPTSDSANVRTFIMHPTIETTNGARLAFYEPLTFDLSNFNSNGSKQTIVTLRFPDGDGYTSAIMTNSGYNTTDSNWTMSPTAVGSTILATGTHTGLVGGTATTANATIGELTYSFFASATANTTTLYLVDPEGTDIIDNPAIIIFEGKDDNNEYHAIVIDLEKVPAGTSSDGVGVADALFTQAGKYGHYSASLASDSDITKDIDWYGTLVTQDANTASQKTVVISYPSAQVYAKIYIGEEDSVITAGTSAVSGVSQIGNVVFKDTETSSYNTKNVIVVGGSCINSAAAALVGGAYCTADWTTATGVGSGEFLIKGYSSSTVTSKLALLVAGYSAADTVNAATYLRTKKPDTAKAWKGTTATATATEITAA